MKHLVFTLVLLLSVQFSALADNDKPIRFEELPDKAKTFITTYFSDVEIALTKKESDFFGKSYEVIFVNGNKVEFDRGGDWTDVNCKFTEVPQGIVPQPIVNYVRNNYGEVRIVSIDKDKRDYEVELSSGIELTFDKKFNLIDIDY
jgi:Protein of unknown function (DUF2874).